MWFDVAARSQGVEAANDLNRAAIRAMVPFEVSRLCAALRVTPAALVDAAAAARFVAAGVCLVTPESVSSHLRVWAGERSLQWEWDEGESFAYKGMQRFGWLDGYRCGVIYRIECSARGAGGAASRRAGPGAVRDALVRPLCRRPGALAARLGVLQ